MDIENTKAQMRKGVLEMCILAIIATEESYPGDIISHLKTNELIIKEGTLYPLLTRLKNSGLIEYTWRESNAGPPRKYFSATLSGEEALVNLSASWDALVNGVNRTMETALVKAKDTKKSTN